MTKPQPLDLEEIFESILKELEFFRQEILSEKQDREFEKVFIKIEKKIREIKQRLKSACDFYLRYKDNPELLIKEYNEFSEIVKRNNWDFLESKIDEYNEWLFKLAFKDVLEVDKNSKI